MFKFIWGYLKSYRLSLIFVICCSILTAFVNLMEPYLTAKFIDEILIGRDKNIFYQFILLLAVISFFAITANWFSTVLSSKMRLKINNQVIRDVMNHVYKTRSDFIFNTDMVYLSKRIDQDVIDLVYFVIGSMVDVCINFALLCMALGLLFSIGAKWGCLFVITAVLHGFAYRDLEKILFLRAIEVRETDSKYFTCLSDMFLYVYSIKLHSLYEEWKKKFKVAFEKNFLATMRQVKIIFWFSTNSLNANTIFKVLIFLIGGVDVLNDELSVGNFVALNGYYMLAMQGVTYFMSVGQLYQNALAAYTRIIEIKNVPSETNGSKVLKSVHSIELRDLHFSFGDKKIFTEFNQSFLKGKIYCIIGKNGVGKSTLMNLLCGMICPTSGEVFFDNDTIANIDMIDARKNLIAVVEQKSFIKNDTISGGERRKISIDNALEKSASVLIMDEPDNNLDTNAIAILIKKILATKLERITILISHDERLINIADEIVKL